MLKLFKKIKDDSYEFKPLLTQIEERPSNPLGAFILYVVIAVILFGLLWLFFAKIDVVVSAQGKIIPDGEIKILKPIEGGVVSKILVKEGDIVKQNDPLILIDPSVTKVNLNTKKEILKSLHNSIDRLKMLTNLDKNLDIKLSDDDELRLFLNQKQNYHEKIEILNAKIDQINSNIMATKEDIKKLNLLKQSDLNRLERLMKVKDIISLKEIDELKNNQIQYSSNIKISNSKLNELNSKLNETTKELSSFILDSRSQWLDELLTKQKEANSLQADINAVEFQTKQQIITSPVDGYVGKLLVHTENSAINSGEQLITIIPSNQKLIIKANVLNKDIGFLKEKQKVAIKIDTFNFQKYGKLDGVLSHIANDSIQDERLGEIYEIKVTPLQTSLLVDSENKNIEPGMSVIAEIKVGKRRVIEFFIYPIIRYLDEGMSVR